MKTKMLSYRKQYRDAMRLGIWECPSFYINKSKKETKKLYYGKDALAVRFGRWIYNVSGKPEIYSLAK